MCIGNVSGARIARVWYIFCLAEVCFRDLRVLVYHVSGACLARVWLVAGASLVRVVFLFVWRVSEACLEGVWRVEPAWRACGTHMAFRDCD